MTPKEKAIDLTADFYDIKSNEPDYGMEWEMAKKCALIAVDEILNSRPSITESQVEYQNFWQEVKQEINKL